MLEHAAIFRRFASDIAAKQITLMFVGDGSAASKMFRETVADLRKSAEAAALELEQLSRRSTPPLSSRNLWRAAVTLGLAIAIATVVTPVLLIGLFWVGRQVLPAPANIAVSTFSPTGASARRNEQSGQTRPSPIQ